MSNLNVYEKVEDNLAPQDILNRRAKEWNTPIDSEAFARKLDETDPLKHFRNEFHFPKLTRLPKVDQSRIKPDSECVYFCGHSLGLEPKRARKAIDVWLEDWADLGVHGHVHGRNPFAYCDYPCIPTLLKLLGAKENEVAVMNQLTSNIHFMMIPFYRPTPKRFKILFEQRAFPSDEYAFRSQIQFHGYKPEDAIVFAKPRNGEDCIRNEDILELIKEHGKEIALVFLSSVQFVTGQFFDMEKITKAAQKEGCVVGWDLAHAAGNIPLKLHDWNVDFAVFCTYKYLNSGAGCIGGAFIHSNHFDKEYPQFDGWWGNRDSTRFNMASEIERGTGANGLRISNPSIHQCATLAASLEVFNEAGIENLRKKSKLLTQYLQYMIENKINKTPAKFKMQILTPTDPEQRGAQLAVRIIGADTQQVFNELERFGVCLDRRADILRLAPIPLYNSFMDVYRFVSILKTINN